MKKKLFLILGFTLIASVSNSQVGIQISCADGWWTDCCRCRNCMQVDPRPSFGYCRHCRLLCAKCRNELGDLQQLWEKLRNLNRALYEAYKANQADYTKALEGVNAAYENIWGEEVSLYDPLTWGNNLKGSFGGFFTSSLSLTSNFGGGRALTVVTNAISIYQSGGSPSETFDFGSTWGGVGLDILGDDLFQQWYEQRALKTVNWNLIENYDRVTKGDIADFLKFRKDLENKLAKEKEFSGKANLYLDIISMAMATNELANNIYDLNLNLTDAEANKKLMESVPDSIAKNADLMVCIKETLDSLKSGSLGTINKRRYISPLFNLALLTSGNSQGTGFLPFSSSNPFIYVDTIKTRSAIGRLNELKLILNQNLSTFEKEIVPLFLPWRADKLDKINRSTQLQLLRKLKTSLTKLISTQAKLKSLAESVKNDLLSAFSGYELDFDGKVETFTDTAITSPGNKWELKPAPALKGDFGTMKMVFPTDAEWSIDFYKPVNNFITNRSKVGKKSFENLAPGTYKLVLNSVPIENVVIEKGKQTELKYGILHVRTHGSWELRSQSDDFLTSRNKPVKLVLPVGQYILRFEKTKYNLVIRERMTVNFRLPVQVE